VAHRGGIAPATKTEAKGLRVRQRFTHISITADYEHDGIAKDMSIRAEQALRDSSCEIHRRDTVTFNVLGVRRHVELDEEYPL